MGLAHFLVGIARQLTLSKVVRVQTRPGTSRSIANAHFAFVSPSPWNRVDNRDLYLVCV
jgi:hypothetical protein